MHAEIHADIQHNSYELQRRWWMAKLRAARQHRINAQAAAIMLLSFSGLAGSLAIGLLA